MVLLEWIRMFAYGLVTQSTRPTLAQVEEELHVGISAFSGISFFIII